MRYALLLFYLQCMQTSALPRASKVIEKRQSWWSSSWGSDPESSYDEGPEIDIDLEFDESDIDVDIEIDIDFGLGGDWSNPRKGYQATQTTTTTTIQQTSSYVETTTQQTSPVETTSQPTHPYVENMYRPVVERPTVTSTQTNTVTAGGYSTSTETVPTTYVNAQVTSQKPSEVSSGTSPSGSSQNGNCAADSSSSMSDGVNGKPSKSMIDSINYVRRYWYPGHTCLKWSSSLAEFAQKVVTSGGDEGSNMRPIPGGSGNIAVIWGGGYGGGYTDIDYASTLFEQSLFSMLCENKDDAHLHNTCPASLGPQRNADNGCNQRNPPPLSQCIGHYQTIVDADNAYGFMGCYASSSGFSCEFSNKQ